MDAASRDERAYRKARIVLEPQIEILTTKIPEASARLTSKERWFTFCSPLTSGGLGYHEPEIAQPDLESAEMSPLRSALASRAGRRGLSGLLLEVLG